MNAGFSVDTGVLLAGVLLLVGVVASGFTSRLRIPSLLLFLGLGMLVADDGLALVRFDNAALAQNIAVVALVVILFEGGLGTDPGAFRSVGAPAAALASVGVAITATVVALVAWLVMDLEPTTAFLLGSVVASTDAAAVFAALRSESLPTRTQQLLQLESGMNDPVAVLLTIGVLETWRADPGVTDWVWFLGVQLGAGVIAGLLVGRLGRWMVDRVSGTAAVSVGVVTLAIAGISYGAAAAVGGSGFLAVYLTGVVLTGSRRASRGVLYFHEGLAATMQGVLFLMLGTLVFPSQLTDHLGVAIVAAATLILLARPIAVALVLLPWRMPLRRMAVVSWAGLRGAVPVVLATIPFTAGHPDGAVIFNVAFVVVILSVALQAPTVGALARRLGVVGDERVRLRSEIIPVDAHDADLVEIRIPDDANVPSTTLRVSPPPAGARIAVIHRNDATVVAHGDTTIEAGDVMLIIAPRSSDLDEIERWGQSFVAPEAEPEPE
ncbi:potassium/proton antiporter [Ilumatobacter coccineus]|uniref:Putative sodium/proton antiporter n=1 Tax=Ilumatobacter coccineus (strain NBRC 103263 / KCTC 29153 / YM16-304) TaxID=1313172 RepID=A0A6C7E9G0_ILUCY|nr:potassium/proton antiporter [Ilumatobacter coccineus]BAN00686.1 putative sodium/proton antiporter [Ilumatobacter coccineus YM16-304]